MNIPTGNLFYEATDYQTSGENVLRYTRYYNSRDKTFGPLGVNWLSNFDRSLVTNGRSQLILQRPGGAYVIFTFNGVAWVTDTDVDLKVTGSGTSWTLTDHNDNVEVYTGSSLQLASITARNGYKQTLAYTSDGRLATVTDSYGRTLSFTYNSIGLLQGLLTPDGTTITYGYTAASGATNLTSVTYPTSTPTTLSYVYDDPNLYFEKAGLPIVLVGVIDENGSRYLSWIYDANTRVATSTTGTGANAKVNVVAYDDTTGNRTVTNALGVTDTYAFTTLQAVPKVTSITRAVTSTTAAATRIFTYDSNGYMNSMTDWNGNQTTLVSNSAGLPTTINEAVGTSVARTTTITYDSVWARLPATITTPGLTTAYIYDANGEPLTKTLTDTTATTVPYSTNGQKRVWTYTWANYLLASVQGPRTDLTAKTYFNYSTTGALHTVTDALNHLTTVTSNTEGGLPLTVVDPDDVTTTLTYDQRQRTLSSAVSTAGGVRTTKWSYANSGEVTTTLPDGSGFTTLLDTAHRFNGISNTGNEQYGLTLDVNGDPVATSIENSAGTKTFSRTATFDALGRKLKDTSAVTQLSYTSTFDNNGNALTLTDPLTHKTTRLFDALNRLYKSTDANSGITSAVYDAHDRPTTITAPNGAVTKFVYDGFGDVIEQISPDSGTTVYRYDADGNLAQKTNALKIVAIYTYDALDRPLSVKYPADATQNVAFTYDQTGHGFGIGRLTSLTDAAGSLNRTYDERGNLLSEKRVNGTNTLNTAYSYDPASRLSSITYPSGLIATYKRDTLGRVSGVTAGKSGVTPAAVVSGMGYLPFGQDNALTFGNGIAEVRSFDLDYRMTGLTDTGTASALLQKLTYGLDAASNVHTITDGVTAANSQTLGYDVLNRLTSATGFYGTLGYGYDANGNRLKQTLGSVTTTYAYTPASNILASYTVGTAKTTVATNANGNITNIPPANSIAPATFAYNVANRLSSVVGSPIGATFLYDAFGQRFSKTDPGYKPNLYIYDQGGTLLEENDNGIVTDYLYANGRPIGTYVPSTGKVYFIQTDHLGTPQMATDGTQKAVWKTTYQPFGTTGLTAASIAQSLRLPGQFADPETGFSYNLNRDYMPNLGRYLESDPIGLSGGSNPYAYSKLTPIRNIDSSGLYSFDEFEIDSLQALAGISDKLTFGVTGWARRGLNRDYADPCSAAYAGGSVTGDVYGLVSGATELSGAYKAIEAERRIGLLTFKNNRWYGGQRGAVSSTQVEKWTDELNEATGGLFLEAGKSLGELGQSLAGGEGCGCKGH